MAQPIRSGDRSFLVPVFVSVRTKSRILIAKDIRFHETPRA
jgi:hypothetical protein